ncbi:MAG: hypothetical protein HY360_27420, partial [Verrucomicrobia bacterium]|nr:hypothetical protein [Verrucomicrobiota bacterium]
NPIGATQPADVPRIPKTLQPDGVACDWMTGVNDGALLLMRVIASPEVYALIQQDSLQVQYGYVKETANNDFASIIAREGVFRDATTTEETTLGDLTIEKKGEDFQADTRRKVVDLKVYHPPTEFDLDTPLNPERERKVNLAVKITGVVESRGTKPNAIALVRPPLVLVHGVNSEPAVWDRPDEPTALVKQFETDTQNFGFICRDFRVDHHGPDPTTGWTGEGDTLGFGEISHMYAKVADMAANAKKRFRMESPLPTSYFEPVEAGATSKRIAVQKVDVVAHSYGGLLSRWYIERAGDPVGKEFDDRRDVRKLITLGTPHRGSPLANLVCEAFKNGLIDNALTHGFFGAQQIRIHDFLMSLDGIAYGGTVPAGQTPALPNALTAQRNAARHAYQVFSVNSQRLAQLNGVQANVAPLHNDVAYGAVVGTHTVMDIPGPFDGTLYQIAQPTWNGWLSFERFYFPWVETFHNAAGATDAIVPEWSARIGLPSHNAEIDVNHVSMGNSPAINQQVRAWLNGAVPLGRDQRQSFLNTRVPQSVQNAYVGSEINPITGLSKNAGLRRNAIVKVELQPDDDSDFYGIGDSRPQSQHPVASFGTAPNQVGIRPTALTGMIRQGAINTTAFSILVDRALTDTTLHSLGILNLAQLQINDPQPQANDHAPYRITLGRIGRRHLGKLTGPNGAVSSAAGSDFVGYASAAIPSGGGQSPPTTVLLPDFVLPAPIKGGPGNLTLTLSGAAETRQANLAGQINHVRVYDRDQLLNPDDLLGVLNVNTPHPANVWNGLLIPYSTTLQLFINNGKVAGPQGSSGENPAQVYQKLIEPGGAPDSESDTVTVP